MIGKNAVGRDANGKTIEFKEDWTGQVNTRGAEGTREKKEKARGD